MHVNVEDMKKKVTKKDNIYKLKRINRVEITFPVAPYATNETLSWLYESGVIDWDTFVTYALRNNNFPDTKKKMPKRDPEIIKEVANKMQGKRKREDTN